MLMISGSVLVFQHYSVFLLSPTTVYRYLKYVPVIKNAKQGKKVDCEAVRLLRFQFILHFNF